MKKLDYDFWKMKFFAWVFTDLCQMPTIKNKFPDSFLPHFLR